MKDATRAPLFACLYPGLCDKARALGYALAIHGTVTRDLDLVAIPWTDKAVSAVALKDSLMEHIAAVGYEDLLRRDSPFLTNEQIDSLVSQQEGTNPRGAATQKPHGRLAWNLYLYCGTKVDLSVMPRLSSNNQTEGPAESGPSNPVNTHE